MNEDASDAQKATLRQYRQLADYLIGKGVEAIDDLYAPYNVVDDLVTDDDGRYQQVASEIPGVETVRLYEDYLRNCESTGDI